MSGFELRGWEVVMTGVPPALLESLVARGVKATSVTEGQYTFELPRDARPEDLIAQLRGAGATLVSVTPVHTTLEEIFVQQVRKAGSAREGVL